jgi:hypothetical protein
MSLADLLQLLARIVAGSIWRTLGRLPLYLSGAAAACCLFAGFVWWMFLKRPPLSAAETSAVIVIAPCYGAAALLWGVHRAIRDGALHALGLYETESPKVFDAILDPLVARVPPGGRKISLGEARVTLDEYMLEPAPSESGLALTSRFAGWLARRALRRQLRLVKKVLDTLAENGETHVWPMSLKNYLRDRIVDISLSAAERRVRRADHAVAATVFLLLAVPAVVLEIAAL